jgi:hypothetical protein
MKNGLFRLASNDFVKGLVTAILSAIIIALYNIIIVSNFDFFTVDWTVTLHAIVNAGGITFISYLAKNFLTDNNGKIAGVVEGEKPDVKA